MNRDALIRFLPEELVGKIVSIETMRGGQSSASLHAVSTSRGEYVLRIEGERRDATFWTQQLLVLRRAAELGIAPAILHIDETARAILSLRVAGAPFAAALGDPAQRRAALISVVERLRLLHAINKDGVRESDPVGYVRTLLQTQSARPAYPDWAAGAGDIIDQVAAMLAGDPRRVVSHNDVNPGNLLWDGVRVWMVDWEVAGLAHSYYDLATLAMFLNLDEENAAGLIGLHDGTPPDHNSIVTFNLLRRFAALLCGLTFLNLVPDLGIAPADPLTLPACYAGMRSGALDPETAPGRATFGMALLRVGTA